MLQQCQPLLHVSMEEAKENEETNRSWLAINWPRRSNERFDYVYTTRCPREDKGKNVNSSISILRILRSLDSLRVLAIRLLAIVDAHGSSKSVKRLEDA